MMMFYVSNVKLFIKQRDEVLESENMRGIVETMIHSSVQRNVAAHHTHGDEEDWNLKALLDYVHANLLR